MPSDLCEHATPWGTLHLPFSIWIFPSKIHRGSRPAYSSRFPTSSALVSSFNAGSARAGRKENYAMSTPEVKEKSKLEAFDLSTLVGDAGPLRMVIRAELSP